MHWTVFLEGGPRRVNHAAVAIGDKIYSFGGYCTGEDYKQRRPIDLYVLNAVTLRWSAVPLARPDDPNVPFQRYGHSAVAYDDNAYIWGGRNDVRACNKLYCYDTVQGSWSHIQTKGTTPRARDGHSACIINRSMYIFGGYEEDLDRFTQDVHALNLETLTWSFILTEGTAPKWRDFHSASAIGNCMYVFGGRGDRQGPFHSPDEDYCNMVMYLDVTTRTWHSPTTRGTSPIGRRSHSAFVHQGALYIFGGYNGVHQIHYGDMHRYDPVTLTWSRVKIIGNGPCPRRRQGCCLIKNKLYVFGGTSPYPPEQQQTYLMQVDGVDPTLMDHSDLYILDFSPSLKTLCKMKIIEQRMDISCLPFDLRLEIKAMTTHNTISRPLNNSG